MPDMSAPEDVPMNYAASVNPPRRAKRPRTGSLGDGPSSPTTSTSSPQQRRAPARPPILPRQQPAAEFAPPASPDSESGSDEDDYNPSRDPPPAPKRRGRKPGTMSRSARESLRKLNHSRIEKARRTKINETLSTLSTLVSERDAVLPSSSARTEPEEPAVPAEDKAKKGKGKGEGEKEFKLDVLVKTVEYMQDLIARVQALEPRTCARCSAHDGPSHNAPPLLTVAAMRRTRSPVDDAMQGQVPPSPKRRREDEAVEHIQRDARRLRLSHHEDDDSYGGDDEHGLAAAEDEQSSPMPFAAPASARATASASPRLPPIASWLPHPYVDPSSLMPPAVSPKPGGPSAVRSPPANAQLPSPPPSGRFRPAITLANMPALALPAPAHPLVHRGPGVPSAAAAQRVPPQQQRKSSMSASPMVSPTWTPEDESAASLLLQMSSKPRSSSTSSTSSGVSLQLPRGMMSMPMPMTPREESVKERERGAFPPRGVEVATPGALLGMRD